MTKWNMVLKTGLMTTTVSLLAGAQSCSQNQASDTPTRVLKKPIGLSQVTSPSLVIPGVGSFDFQTVANQQMGAVIETAAGFSFHATSPANPGASSASDAKLMSVASSTATATPPTSSTIASCLLYTPMANLGGAINSFEIVGGGGITLGFTPAGVSGLGANVGSVDFNVQYAQLDVAMSAVDPLSGEVLSAVDVTAGQTKTTLNADINLGMFNLAPSAFYQTPLAAVTQNALSLGVAGLQTGMTNDDWYTRVLANQGSTLTIVGGNDLGLQVGDQLAIYNEVYYWDGTPCASTYRGGVSATPVATGTVTTVGDEISLVTLTTQTSEAAVVGAKVTVVQLAPAVTTTTGSTSK